MENNNNYELEQMREQLRVLNEKLEKQEIINEKLIHQTIKNRFSWIKNYVYIEFAFLPIIFFIWFFIKEFFNLSWFSFGFMIVMCITDVIWDYRINVTSLDLEKADKNNITETLLKLIKMKKMRARSFSIMMPLCALWIVWTGAEMWQKISAISEVGSFIEGAAYGGFIGLLIGAPFGLYLALRIYRKMQLTNDSLIAQINEFSNNLKSLSHK